jgi:2-succinyl-5-enolpyruvyl-6-hydroxy-3-cyclohexene-1-carboxylate synthase
MTQRPADVQATYCATLVDTWITAGVRHAVIAPGSRSTPMALAITDRDELDVHVVHDERAAAFVALGLGLDGTPALLLCTSGTAAANFFPAVVEAALSDVPVLVLTADRPEELRGVGAPQAIDQVELYGRHVRWFADPGVPEAAAADRWRVLAVDAWRHAADGPVQLNLAFREPLLGVAGELPSPEPIPGSFTVRVDRSSLPSLVASAQRGVILVGGRSGVAADDVTRLQMVTGWPLLADPISGMRSLDGAVVHADALLRHPPFVSEHRPDLIVRIGRPAASKVLAQWSASAGAPLVQVGGPGVIDPDHNVAAVVDIGALLTARAASPAAESGWLEGWLDADRRAGDALEATLAAYDEITEPAVARTVAERLPDDARLVVASSMPVRDLEWFGGRRARAHANRGANGIDGTLSTALGVALGGRSTVVLTGDLAFVHDANALVALRSRNVDLRVVVVDNDGGGIFSFLPQASVLGRERFEQLFGTPLGVDVVALAAAHGIDASVVDTLDGLATRLAAPGPSVTVVRTSRQRNVDVHDELHAAAAAAL